MAAGMADKGIRNAKQGLDNISGLCGMFEHRQAMSFRKVRDAITDEKFREKLCCLKCDHQQHWKMFDPSKMLLSIS